MMEKEKASAKAGAFCVLLFEQMNIIINISNIN